MKSGRLIAVFPMVATLAVGAMGCRDDRQTAAPAAKSPAETARLLHELHGRKDFAGIAPLVVAEGRDATIDLLKAVGDVLDANARLRQVAMMKFGAPSSDTWSLSSMENNLGPFSRDVRLLNESFKGDRAIVTLQEGENIPLVHAEFEWRGGQWQFKPEPTPRTLPEELRALARVLREVQASSLERGASFDAYTRSFVSKVLPQMERVVMATDRPIAPLARGTGEN